MRTCTLCGEEKELTEFYTRKNGVVEARCKLCFKAKVKKYAEANREKVRVGNRAASAKFRGKNLEAERSRTLEWYHANRERCSKLKATYTSCNLDKHSATQARRRARKLQATPDWANQRYIDLFYAMAREESEATGVLIHVDHIVPLKHDRVCGLHVEHNLQLLEASANLSKSNRFWPDM